MEGLPPLPYGREPWLELERKELQIGFRATGTARAGQTAALAVALLDQIAREYWNIWEASGERAKVFVRWLPSIKSRALTEVGDFWQSLQADWGEPPSGLRYDCNWPVVEAALSEAVGRWSVEAWQLERQRLDPRCPAIEGKNLNQVAELAECASRLVPGSCSVPGEWPVNGDVGPGNVPDSAMAENITADPKAKAIESGNNRQRDTHAAERIPEELVRARYGALTRYRNQKKRQTMGNFAHDMGASIATIQAIVRQDKARYSDEKHDRLLQRLGIPAETWNSAEALKQLDWACAPEA